MELGCRVKPSEAQFRGAIVELAEWTGHRVFGIRRSDGVLVSDTSIGWPDLVIAKPGRLLIPELKVGKNRRTLDQNEWAAALPDEYYRLWTPADWPGIEATLKRK